MIARQNQFVERRSPICWPHDGGTCASVIWCRCFEGRRVRIDMRAQAVYIRRCYNRPPLGVVPLCSPATQRNYGPYYNTLACEKTLCEREAVEASSQDHESNDHVQEPPYKIRRTELECDPPKEAQEATTHPTRSVLQGIMSFFKLRDNSSPCTSLSVPKIPLPRPLCKIFSSRENEEKQSLSTTKNDSDNKENIPPSEDAVSSEVAALRAFRQEVTTRQERAEGSPRRLEQPQHHHHLSAATPAEREASAALGPKKRPVLRRSRRGGDTGNVHVSYKQFYLFVQLMESSTIQHFLKADVCCRYADKYLLAMAFTYLVRARVPSLHYTKEHFFAALYLAHDMEEDEEELKYEVLPWALGPRWRKTYPSLLQLRDDIFWAIDCRAVVSKRGCDQVMALQPDSWLWKRERPLYHGGAVREYMKDLSNNGQPRGPTKSPLQCQLCLERECASSQNSYLLYLSDSGSSVETLFLDAGTTEEHKERDSGFETFLFGASDSSLFSPQEVGAEKVAEERREGVLVPKCQASGSCKET